MGLWSRLQQWVYARPRVAVTGATLVLLLVGAGGWESARVASPARAQAVTTVYGVKGAHMIQVEADVAPVTRVVTHVIRFTRTITTRRPAKTVTKRRIVTRTVPSTHTIREIATVTVATPVTVRTQTTREPVGGSRSTTRVVTVTEVKTETEIVTQPPVTMTVTVTTTRGRGH